MLNMSDLDDTECEWLRSQMERIEAEFADEPCVDNFRLADKSVDSQVRAYDDAVATGCCGSFDTEFGPSPGGRTYLWGFNYGH